MSRRKPGPGSRLFVVAVVVLILLVALTGCGGSPTAAAPESPAKGTSIEQTIEDGCGSIYDMATVTEKVGYGSQTDYILVVCGNQNTVRRFEVN